MKQYFRITVIIILWLITALFSLQALSQVGDRQYQAGQRIYHTLNNKNLLESYLIDIIDDVISRLMDAAGIWQSYQINGPYRKTIINIYLVNWANFPEVSLIEDYDLSLTKYNLQMNALTDSKNKIIYVDTDLLKTLLTCVLLKTNKSMKISQSLVLIEKNGLDAYQSYWDPRLNQALHNEDYLRLWDATFRGVVAFIVGHELGHIYYGHIQFTSNAEKVRLYSENVDIAQLKTDRDRILACQEYLNSRSKKRIEDEKKADDFCANLLLKIFFPGTENTNPALWFETGATFFFNFLHAQQLIKVLQISDSSHIQAIVTSVFGSEFVNFFTQTKSKDKNGIFKKMFSNSHPFIVYRQRVFKEKLSQSPYSLAEGGIGENLELYLLLEETITEECTRLKEKYNLK